MKMKAAQILLVLSGGIALAGDPSHYVKKATWHETLLASREAIGKGEEAAGRGALPDLGRSDFTLCAWIRTKEAGGTILAKAPAEGAWAPQGKVLFLRGGAPTVDVGWVGAVRADNRTVNDSAWHHVALAGREPLAFYVDGVLVKEAALALGADPAESVFKIGFCSDNFPESGGFRGDIDDVRIYGRRLAAAEIARARDDETGRDPAPIGSWPLDGDAAERMGSGRDGTIAGATAVDGKHGKALRFAGKDRVVLPSSEADVARRGLWAFIDRDFTDAKARQEIARERKDGVWDRDWKPGDLRALAARYAALCEDEEQRAEAAALAGKAGGPEDLWKVRAMYYTPPPIRFAEEMPLDADPHLVGWWRFDETSGTAAKDSSKHGRNGVLGGGVTFDASAIRGRFGWALQFDGRDDAVTIPGYKGITGSGPRTISVWLKTKANRGEIVTWGEDEPGRSWFFGFIRGRPGVTPKGGYYYMKAPVSDDAWHHVAVVVGEADSPNLHDDVTLFLDGDVAAIDDIGLLDLFPIDTGADQDVTIGKGYEGAIDDLRIFDRALSEEEVIALFRVKRK